MYRFRNAIIYGVLRSLSERAFPPLVYQQKEGVSRYAGKNRLHELVAFGWQGMFKGHKEGCTVILEAVVSQRSLDSALFLWHGRIDVGTTLRVTHITLSCID
jgi:hypothetical protein